jgi:hypothetical protein
MRSDGNSYSSFLFCSLQAVRRPSWIWIGPSCHFELPESRSFQTMYHYSGTAPVEEPSLYSEGAHQKTSTEIQLRVEPYDLCPFLC